MELIDEHPASDFTLYFLAYADPSQNLSKEEKASTRFAREGTGPWL